MKKIVIYVALSFFTLSGALAQPWFPEQTNGPVKLQDIVNYYQTHPLAANADEDDKDAPAEKEGKNYQFDRWNWYWQNHTDSNGYLVSPVKTWEEWNAYMQRENTTHKLAKTTGTQSNWTFQGPNSSDGGYHGVGRINVVSFHPSDSNTLWIGSAGGGAWKTTDNGSTWTSMAANLPVLGTSDITFNPLNPNTIYLCTGDRDGGDTYSIGVFKTVDGGNSWFVTGLTFNASSLVQTNSMAINRLDTNTLILATSQGIYRSLNGGGNWTNVFTGNYKQVLYNPADTNVVYATGAHPSGNIQVFRSADGGATWQAVTAISNSNRITMAVTKSNPRIVKAIVSNSSNGLNGIYSSSDSGQTFTLYFDGSSCNNNILSHNFSLGTTNVCGGQGWYDLAFAISPIDSNAVYAGGVNTWGSNDGGKSWHIVDQWYTSLPGIKTVHADKHCLAFNPLVPVQLYECNDGGIHKTRNPSSTLWTDITNGLGITQFYRNAVSNIATFALGGAQDNGCKSVTNSQTAAGEVLGGDGMQVQMDYQNPNVFYAESQNGNISRTTNGGVTMTNISNNIATPALTGSWITPYIISPQDPSMLFAGFDKVYLSQDQGATWLPLSPVFSSGKTIDRVVQAVTNANYLYVLVNNSIRYTTDFGTTWHTMSVTYNGSISDIVVDPKDETILYITYSGYTTTKVARHSLNTNLWTAMNGQLPNIPVNCLAIDSSNGMMYVGCDIGVYYYDTTATKWTLYNNNLPNVTINDININYTTKELWVATFGRGMWKTPKYDTTIAPPNNGVSIVPFANNVIAISPDPNNGQFSVTTGDIGFINKKVMARLIDATGRTVWHSSVTFIEGKTNVQIPGLKTGAYLFEVKGESALARAKMIVY